MPRNFLNDPPKSLGIGSKLGTVTVAPSEIVKRSEVEKRKSRERISGTVTSVMLSDKILATIMNIQKTEHF